MIIERTVAIVVIIISLVAYKIEAPSIESARLNGPCETPNGEQATCVSILSCPIIKDAVKTRNETATEFARASQCGRDGRIPLVCCGTVAYFNQQIEDIFDIFSPSTGVNRIKPLLTNKDNINGTEILKDLDSKDLPDRSVCGYHTSDDRIFGGERTAVDEFPWMVALEFKDVGVICGGSLINKKFVLTAAHCVKNSEFQLMHVRLGEWNLTSNPDCLDCNPVEIVKVAETIPHPFYSEWTKNNDIALLRLEKEIEFNDFIRPICLPPENFPAPEEGTLLTVSGWGATEHGNTASDIKLKVKVPTISNAKCKEILNDTKIQANQVCAGGVAGKDACQGDSGGPLFRSFLDKLHNRLQWYQEGIVSRGVECGYMGYPAIYTRISRYLTWILHNIESEPLE